MYNLFKYIFYVNIPFCGIEKYTEVVEASIKPVQDWLTNLDSRININPNRSIKYSINMASTNEYTAEVYIWLEPNGVVGDYNPNSVFDRVMNQITDNIQKYTLENNISPAGCSINVITPRGTVHHSYSENIFTYEYDDFIPMKIIELNEKEEDK